MSRSLSSINSSSSSCSLAFTASPPEASVHMLAGTHLARITHASITHSSFKSHTSHLTHHTSHLTPRSSCRCWHPSCGHLSPAARPKEQGLRCICCCCCRRRHNRIQWWNNKPGRGLFIPLFLPFLLVVLCFDLVLWTVLFLSRHVFFCPDLCRDSGDYVARSAKARYVACGVWRVTCDVWRDSPSGERWTRRMTSSLLLMGGREGGRWIARDDEE